jgi:hypothetical protein
MFRLQAGPYDQSEDRQGILTRRFLANSGVRLIVTQLGKFCPIFISEALDRRTGSCVGLPLAQQPIGEGELRSCGIQALVSKQAARDVGRWHSRSWNFGCGS